MNTKIILSLVLLFVISIANVSALGDCMSSPADCEIGEYANREISVDGDEISVKVYLQNIGQGDDANMWSDALLELQVRPKGLPPLSIWVSPLYACDDNHPENVHRRYMLGTPGNQGSITLTSRNPIGKYDLYLFSLDKCYFEPPSEGNIEMKPFGRGTFIGTVEIEEEIIPECTYGDTRECSCDSDDPSAVYCYFCDASGHWRDHKEAYIWCYDDGNYGECVNGQCEYEDDNDNGDDNGDDNIFGLSLFMWMIIALIIIMVYLIFLK